MNNVASVQEKIAPLVDARARRMVAEDGNELEFQIAIKISESQILGRIAFHTYLDALSETI